MPNLLRPTALVISLLLGHAGTALAADCIGDFRTTASPGKGTAYTGVAVQPGAAPAHYAAAKAVLEREGWSVFHLDPATLAVLARNSQKTASGRTGTLGLSFAAVEGGVSLALVYNNPPGVQSPADAVRDQFCKLATGIAAAAAAAPPAPAPASPATGPQPAAVKVEAVKVEAVKVEPAKMEAVKVAAVKVETARVETAKVEEQPLCLAKACLGMSAAQAAALDLQPAGTFKFMMSPSMGGGYGLDAGGKRVTFSNMGDFDSKNIAAFASAVKTICSMQFANAKLKASDGQPIRLTFRPVIKDGKGVLVLTQIDRALPPNLSKSELQRFEETVREQYGSAYSAQSRMNVTRPTAQVHQDFATGTTLRLSLPLELKVHERLMEQPGCSAKPRLD